jgi:hypothetical protein
MIGPDNCHFAPVRAGEFQAQDIARGEIVAFRPKA